MAKFSITSFLKGINTRVNKFRIQSDESVNSEDVDLSNLEIKPQKGLDSSDSTFDTIDYKFKGYNVTDATAEKFTEAGDYLIKSYSNADAEFDRIWYDSSGNSQGLVGSLDLGVPSQPPTPSSSIVSSGSAGGTAEAYSVVKTSSYSSATVNSSTVNSNYEFLPSGSATNHTTSRQFTLFQRYGNTVCMFDAVNKKLRRVDVTTGNAPSNVNSEVTVTYADEYFFVGSYFVGLDSNYNNVSVVVAATGNTSNDYAINDSITGYQAYNSSNYTPGISSLTEIDKDFHVNDQYLFVSKNYKPTRYSYGARETTNSNTGSSYYYPYSYPRLDRPVMYIYSDWMRPAASNTLNDVHLDSNITESVAPGWLYFGGYYEGQYYGGGRYVYMNGAQTNNPGNEYLFFDIGGVQYTCMIVSYLEAYGWSGGTTIRDVIASPSSSINYSYLWRLQKLHQCWISPINPGTTTSGPNFIGNTEIYARAITGVSGSFTDQGDHTEGTHNNVPLIDASDNYTHQGGTSGYPEASGQNTPTITNTMPGSSSSAQYGFGALATVVVNSNGNIQSVTITDGGRGWKVGDVFEIPTSQGTPHYGSSSGSNVNIGGSVGAYGTVTSVDSTFKVNVQGVTNYQLDLSTGQIQTYTSANSGGNTQNVVPRSHTWLYPGLSKSMGSITRLDLSSGSKTFKSFSDNVTDIPQQYGNWGSRYGQGGIHTYKPKYPVNNRLNGANYPPARDNFLLAEKNYSYTAESSSYYVNSNNWGTVQAPIHLVSDSASEFNNSTFSIPTSAPSTSGAGSTSETIHNSSGNALLDGWYTMEASGVASSNDRVFNNPFGSSSVNVYSNILTSGATQFGTIQATLSLSNNGYDLVRQDGANAVFINTGGSGETVNVVNLQNLSVSSGTSFYGYGTDVKDIYKEGNYVVAKVDTNESLIIDTANGNEVSPIKHLFDFVTKVDTSNLLVYGIRVSSLSSPIAFYLTKAYFFFRHEILALGTGGIRDSNGNTRNVGVVFQEYTNNAATNIYHIGYTSTSGTFDRTQSTYNLGISTTRRPQITADAFTEQFTATWNGSNKLTGVPNANMFSTIIDDSLSFGGVSAATVSGYNSTDEITVTGVTGSQASGSVTVTRTRRTHRNRIFVPQAASSNLGVPSLPVFSSTGNYSNIDEMITFADLASTAKFIPHSRSSNDNDFIKSGSFFFSADLDRRIVAPSSPDQDIADSAFTFGGVNIFNNQGANIPFQYKISYLRDIRATTDIAGSTTNEAEPVLIEGPTSGETDARTLNAVTESLELSSLGSNLASDIAKVRVYRVGGDYAEYYWLADLNVSNGSVSNYSDISLEVGSTLITPNDATNPIDDKLTNIVQVNGLFVGSHGSYVYFSEFANPHSWPEDGKYEIDGNINNIVESDGEAVIFTDNAIFRARGFSYDNINIASIPQSQGVSSSNKGSVTKYLGSIFFISNDGLCEYKAGVVRLISQAKFSSFPAITTPRSVFKDGVLYIFEGSSSGTNKGVKVDFRLGEPVFSRINQKATVRALYNQANDTLYVKNATTATTGSYDGSGSDLPVLHESGEIGFGDFYSTKALFKVIVKYKTSLSSASNATIKFYADGSGSEFFTASLTDSTSETCLYFPLQNYELLKYLRYKIEGKVTVYEINYDFEMAESFVNKLRVNYVDVQYVGQLKVDIYIDNGIVDSNPVYATSGSTDLPSSGSSVRTVRLYYPKDTTGYIPHIYYTGTGRVISTSYGTEDL